MPDWHLEIAFDLPYSGGQMLTGRSTVFRLPFASRSGALGAMSEMRIRVVCDSPAVVQGEVIQGDDHDDSDIQQRDADMGPLPQAVVHQLLPGVSPGGDKPGG